MNMRKKYILNSSEFLEYLDKTSSDLQVYHQ